MGIKMRCSMADIQNTLNEKALQIENNLVLLMERYGEEFVKDARSSLNIQGAWKQRVLSKAEINHRKKLGYSIATPVHGDYADQTRNLRGSIGYFILKGGAVVNYGFGNDEQHSAKGEAAARTAVQGVQKKSGYQLVFVAGMDYASYVESKGYNVITSQAYMITLDLTSAFKAYAAKHGYGVGSNGEGLSQALD